MQRPIKRSNRAAKLTWPKLNGPHQRTWIIFGTGDGVYSWIEHHLILLPRDSIKRLDVLGISNYFHQIYFNH
jgi:hypothetical protein